MLAMEKPKVTSIVSKNGKYLYWLRSKKEYFIPLPLSITYQALQELLFPESFDRLLAAASIYPMGFYRPEVTKKIIRQMKQEIRKQPSFRQSGITTWVTSGYYTQKGSFYSYESQRSDQSKPLGVYLVIGSREQYDFDARFSVYVVLRKPGVKVGLGEGSWGFVKVAALLYQDIQPIGGEPKVIYNQTDNQSLHLVALKYFVKRSMNEKSHHYLCNIFQKYPAQYRKLGHVSVLGWRTPHRNSCLYKYYLITGIAPGVPLCKFKSHLLSKLPVKDRLQEILALPHAIVQVYQDLREKGLLHTDVKTSNIIFYGESDKVIARMIDLDYARFGDQLNYGTIVGTVAYLPDELIYAKKNYLVSEQTEIYSLGIVIAEIFKFGMRQKFNKQDLKSTRKYCIERFVVDDELYNPENRPDPFWNLFDSRDATAEAIIYSRYKKVLFKLVKSMTSPMPAQRPSIGQAREILEKAIDRLRKEFVNLKESPTLSNSRSSLFQQNQVLEKNIWRKRILSSSTHCDLLNKSDATARTSKR